MCMKRSELEILLQEGEGTMLEYKEGLSASFARELVAMANTAGGKILLGVRDDSTVKGIRDEAREQGCPEPVFQETGFFTATFYPIQDRFDETTDPGTYQNDHPGKAPQPKTTLPDHAAGQGDLRENTREALASWQRSGSQ
jgi:hypothetical protein